MYKRSKGAASRKKSQGQSGDRRAHRPERTGRRRPARARPRPELPAKPAPTSSSPRSLPAGLAQDGGPPSTAPRRPLLHARRSCDSRRHPDPKTCLPHRRAGVDAAAPRARWSRPRARSRLERLEPHERESPGRAARSRREGGEPPRAGEPRAKRAASSRPEQEPPPASLRRRRG